MVALCSRCLNKISGFHGCSIVKWTAEEVKVIDIHFNGKNKFDLTVHQIPTRINLNTKRHSEPIPRPTRREIFFSVSTRDGVV